MNSSLTQLTITVRIFQKETSKLPTKTRLESKNWWEGRKSSRGSVVHQKIDRFYFNCNLYSLSCLACKKNLHENEVQQHQFPRNQRNSQGAVQQSDFNSLKFECWFSRFFESQNLTFPCRTVKSETLLLWNLPLHSRTIKPYKISICRFVSLF